MSIKSEILGIAKDNGYEGSAQTITGAINALTDTLAGEDVAGGRTVASAIHALGPYIGGGGGGGEIAGGFTLYVQTTSWSGVAPLFVDMVHGQDSLLHVPQLSGVGAQLVLPSGGDYVIGLPPTYGISSIQLTKGGDGTQIEYTTQTVADQLLLLTFSVPAIDYDDDYIPGNGQPQYLVNVMLTA